MDSKFEVFEIISLFSISYVMFKLCEICEMLTSGPDVEYFICSDKLLLG